MPCGLSIQIVSAELPSALLQSCVVKEIYKCKAVAGVT